MAIAQNISSAELRLRKHADYQRAYAAAGRKQHSKEMSFFCALRSAMPQRTLHPAEQLHGGPQGPRIGLTVGKVMGKAHDRNRIKRRMRAAVRMHAGLLDGMAVDVILHPRRTVLLLEWDKLQRDVAQVFRTVKKQCAAAQATALPIAAQDEPR